MIRVSIGRIIRWFLDAAEDADRLHMGHVKHYPAVPGAVSATPGPVEKIDIGPEDIGLRKPVDIPLRSN